MTDSEFELKKKRICDFRYSVVAELGNPYLMRGKLTQLIKEKSNSFCLNANCLFNGKYAKNCVRGTTSLKSS